LPPGDVASFGGPVRKDVAGYDLIGLLTGSEGTLGVITDVWLRLIPRPLTSRSVCAIVHDAAACEEAIHLVLASGVVPAAIEYLDAATMKEVGAGFPGGLSPGRGFLVIAEVDSCDDDVNALTEALGAASFTPNPRELWRWRDGVSHVMTARLGRKVSEDVAVPLERFADAVDRTRELGVQHQVEACSWGHAGDGNLHSTFLFSPDRPSEASRAHAAEAMLDVAVELGGTISGEHGVGVLKNGHLRKQWNRAAVQAHEAIKATLDPQNLMNPGKKRP
jgi:FAD/FMN-containing dehydrogenase